MKTHILETAPRSTISRHYAAGLCLPKECISEAKKDCKELWQRSENLFPIGRVCGVYGSVRFRVERFSDRPFHWYLSDGVRFLKVRQKDILHALEYEAKHYA
tara:strand:- start:304 stop:609 length:306 start_codon:yes stop_codon:yes gene_type:complete